MLKKTIAIVLALGMILCVSACSNEKLPSEPKESQISTTEPSKETQEESSVKETLNDTDVSTVTSETKPVNSQTTSSKPTTNSQPKPSHKHSYSAATCTSPKKCSCGATTGTALGHSFANATCTSPKICNRCGVKSGISLGHNFSAATCFAPKTCARCKITQGETRSHNYVNGICTMCNGKDADWKVSLYDLIIPSDSENTEIAKKVYDSQGNYYDKCIHMFASRATSGLFTQKGKVKYVLSGLYDEFTGTLAYQEEVGYPNGSLQIKVYADDKLVYSKQGITKESKPIKFNIPVTDCNTLEIRVKNINHDYAYLIIGDAELK